MHVPELTSDLGDRRGLAPGTAAHGMTEGGRMDLTAPREEARLEGPHLATVLGLALQKTGPFTGEARMSVHR